MLKVHGHEYLSSFFKEVLLGFSFQIWKFDNVFYFPELFEYEHAKHFESLYYDKKRPYAGENDTGSHETMTPRHKECGEHHLPASNYFDNLPSKISFAH